MLTPKGIGRPSALPLVLLCASQLTLTGEQGAGALGAPPAALTGAKRTPPTHTPSGQCQRCPFSPLVICPRPTRTPPPMLPCGRCLFRATPRRFFFLFKENHVYCFVTSKAFFCRA